MPILGGAGPPGCSAVSGFGWPCTWALMYLPKERGKVVYKHQALEDAQLRWLCLSKTTHTRGEGALSFYTKPCAVTMHYSR